MGSLFCRPMPALMIASLGSIGGLFSSGCNRGAGPDASAGGRPPTNVQVTDVTEADVPVYLDEIGKISAFETVTVMPQVSGRIDTINFADGADLKPNQLLYTIDARPFAAALAQAKGQLAKDMAAQQNAQRFLKRQADIYGKGIVAPSDYDTAVANAAAAAGTVEADNAAVQSAQLNVEYCRIVSPIAGRASLHLVDPGNIVTINQTPLLMIQNLNPIYADFTINERDLPNVREQLAGRALHAFVKLPTDPPNDAGREGELTFVDNGVQDASGTVKMRATIKDNADRHFWPGQYINVRLVLKRGKSILIPQAAPQIAQQGTFVYVVGEAPDAKTGKTATIANMRPVKLGQAQAGNMVVVEGISPSDKVVTNGQVMLFPGAPINIVKPDPAEGGSPGGGAPEGAAPGGAPGTPGNGNGGAPSTPSTQPSAAPKTASAAPLNDAAIPASSKLAGAATPNKPSRNNFNQPAAPTSAPALAAGTASGAHGR